MSARIWELIGDLREEWQNLNKRIAAFEAEFIFRARTDEATRRLATIPGIGSINATALVAAVGDGQAFKRGRDMAAWLGLIPRQQTTGGRPRLLGISKRGNRYLRKNLIHGARAVLPYLAQRGHTARPVGTGATGTSPQEHRGGSTRQQTGAYRLGSIGIWWPVRCRIHCQCMRRNRPTALIIADWSQMLRVVETRWPDSRTAARKPGTMDGLQGRCDYEDRAARISILAGSVAPRPDTLQQTDRVPDCVSHLPTGRAIRSLMGA